MFGVTILGNNSAVPAYDRHPTAQVVTIGGEAILIDCGEGTQFQIKKYLVKRSKITRILISHLHGDHYYGLIGLLSSMALVGRSTPLYLYGPPPLGEVLQMQLKASDSVLPYELIFQPLTKAEPIVTTGKYIIESFPVAHRIPCYGFRITENHAPRRIDSEKVKASEIPRAYYEQLQWGADYTTKDGRVISNASVTLPGKKRLSYAYSADTLFTESFLPYIKGADLLYHESTYTEEFTQQAGERFHSTAKQAAQMAALAGASRLLLGHFSSRFKEVDHFELEAKELFEASEVSKEGVTYLVR